ncbi:hypothetical protein BDY24DRAFT_414665 [Mrakia frigida]|uniref:uncharacterized protein n=1 Tax=Mrakia frigida TaxID=29902 RepID=UPI003FCBF6C6
MSSTTLPSPTLRLHTLTTTLSDLRTQLAQALSLPPPPPPPLSNSLSASSVSLSNEADEIDRRAKEIVEEHIRLLHDLNETRDAAENLIQKYCLMVRRREEDVREMLGLEKGD